jgi:hypothetical protein
MDSLIPAQGLAQMYLSSKDFPPMLMNVFLFSVSHFEDVCDSQDYLLVPD